MTDDAHRSVSIERVGFARFRATNARGGSFEFGEGGAGTDFNAVELLLAAMAGCSAADVDYITNRRAEPESFFVDVTGRKVRDEHGNHLTDLEVVFRVRFPEGAAGDAAREVLPRSVARSNQRLCTVSRTVQIPTPVAARVEPPA